MKPRATLVACLIAAVLVVLFLRWRPHGPALVMRAEYPARVHAGREFALRLFIGNPSARPVRLADVDFDQALVDGVAVVGITPSPRRAAMHRRLGVLSLSYDEELPAHTLREWLVRLKAVTPGPVRGELAVYSATNVRSDLVQLTVIP